MPILRDTFTLEYAKSNPFPICINSVIIHSYLLASHWIILKKNFIRFLEMLMVYDFLFIHFKL